MNNREKAEKLYFEMARLETNSPSGTMLSSAVLCDYAGKCKFIRWIENQLIEYDGHD